MSTLTVAIFRNNAQAEPIANRLISSGIKAEVHDGLALAKFWFVSRKEAGVRLEVPADQLEKACNLLLDLPEMQNAIRCLKCRSFRVEYPQFTHKSMLPNLVVGLLAAIGRVEKQYYCSECHHTWPKDTKPVKAPASDYLLDKTEPRDHKAA